MENLVGNAISEAIREVAKDAIGRGLEEVEAAKNKELSIILQSRCKLGVGINLI